MKELIKLIKKSGKYHQLTWSINKNEFGKDIHMIAGRTFIIQTNHLKKEELAALVEAFGKIATEDQPLAQAAHTETQLEELPDTLIKVENYKRMIHYDRPNKLERTYLHNSSLTILAGQEEYIFARDDLFGLIKGDEIYCTDQTKEHTVRTIMSKYSEEIKHHGERWIKAIIIEYKPTETMLEEITQYLK